MSVKMLTQCFGVPLAACLPVPFSQARTGRQAASGTSFVSAAQPRERLRIVVVPAEPVWPDVCSFAGCPDPEAIPTEEPMNSSARIILLVILVILLLGLLPVWPYSGSFGYYPSGGIGLVLLVLIILLVVGKI